MVAAEHLRELGCLPVAHRARHRLHRQGPREEQLRRPVCMRARWSSRLNVVPPTSARARWSWRRLVAISCATARQGQIGVGVADA